MAKLLVWALGIFLIVSPLLAAGDAAAAAPVSVGKIATPGASAVAYAQSSSPAGAVILSDGQLVYDSQVSVELANFNYQTVTVPVSVEEWTPGSVLETVTGPNNTTRQISVPTEVDPWWSNTSLTALAGSSSTTSVALPYVASQHPLRVTVGSASWQFVTLTPVTDSLAGIYSSGGLEAVEFVEAVVITAVMFGFLAGARRFGLKVHRTPKVPVWWPVAWIGIPIAFYLLDYVPTNQLLGSVSVFAYPFVIGAAAFPYLPRLWREFDWAEFQGVEPRHLEEATNAKAVLPIVQTKEGLRCAPETWWEVLYTLWGVPLPAIIGQKVTLLGRTVQVQPRGMRVSNPLGPYYESDATIAFWFDARAKILRVRHRFEWHREQKEDRQSRTSAPVESQPSEVVVRSRLSPHVVPGYLAGVYPPLKPVAEHLAGIRREEVEAHDNESDRLLVAQLIGTGRREAREAAQASLARYDQAVYEETKSRSQEEIDEALRRSRRDRAGGGVDEAEGSTKSR
ncbi:MAG: hypothetical protein WBF81_08175 [Thermoplasmata archaeon]